MQLSEYIKPNLFGVVSCDGRTKGQPVLEIDQYRQRFFIFDNLLPALLCYRKFVRNLVSYYDRKPNKWRAIDNPDLFCTASWGMDYLAIVQAPYERLIKEYTADYQQRLSKEHWEHAIKRLPG